MCDKYVPGCVGPHCLGAVDCHGDAACVAGNWQGVDCFYVGRSTTNWKVCSSPACENTPTYDATAPRARGNGPKVRRPGRSYDLDVLREGLNGCKTAAQLAAADASVPTLSELGGEAFLAALGLKLNTLRDLAENGACRGTSGFRFLENLVYTPDSRYPECEFFVEM